MIGGSILPPYHVVVVAEGDAESWMHNGVRHEKFFDARQLVAQFLLFVVDLSSYWKLFEQIRDADNSSRVTM